MTDVKIPPRVYCAFEALGTIASLRRGVPSCDDYQSGESQLPLEDSHERATRWAALDLIRNYLNGEIQLQEPTEAPIRVIPVATIEPGTVVLSQDVYNSIIGDLSSGAPVPPAPSRDTPRGDSTL